MTGTKVLLILLILMVILFVVFVFLGIGNNGTTDTKTLASEPHGILDAFNSVLAPFGPKFKINALQPSVGVFDLRLQPGYSVRVLADADHKFRQAKFSVQPEKACADVKYFATGKLPPNVTNPQESLKSDDAKHPNPHPDQFTFTIFEGGGMLTVQRGPGFGGVCKMTLQ